MTDAHEVIPAQSREIAAPQDQSATLLHVIQQAATNPDVDVEKVERLYELLVRQQERDAKASFNASLSRAQAAMGRVSADANNPQTRSKYASYAALDRALRPVYTTEGFAVSFDNGDAPEGTLRTVLVLSHKGGHTERYHRDTPIETTGIQGKAMMTRTHATASAESYNMRYLLKRAFNVAIGEDEDDGNAAGGIQYITQDQQDTLQALIEDVGADKQKFLAHMRAEGGLAYIRADHYDAAVRALEKKRGQA
jgi:hypothetical protein